jgi:hypothetical protein
MDKRFSLHQSVQTGSEAHRIPHLVGVAGTFSTIKRSGCESDHQPPSSEEVKNSGAIPPIPNTSSLLST